MLFTDLQLIKPILDALTQEGYEKPTPIQSQAIPHLLEGKDLLGTAQTGTEKPQLCHSYFAKSLS